jgi:hypothetical protein
MQTSPDLLNGATIVPPEIRAPDHDGYSSERQQHAGREFPFFNPAPPWPGENRFIVRDFRESLREIDRQLSPRKRSRKHRSMCHFRDNLAKDSQTNCYEVS